MEAKIAKIRGQRVPSPTRQSYGGEVWPVHLLINTLLLKSTPKSVIQLIPQIKARFQLYPSHRDWSILDKLLRHVARHRMLVLIPHITDIMLERLEKEEDTMKPFDKFLGSLRHLVENGELPKSVLSEVKRAVKRIGPVHGRPSGRLQTRRFFGKGKHPIDDMLASRKSGSLKSVLKAVEPHLNGPYEDYAWSILLANLPSDITAEELESIEDGIPLKSKTPPVMTPLMQAYSVRGDYEKAWEIWSEIKEPDAVALAVASEACYGRFGLDNAVKCVDTWSTTIQLDTRNLNALLKMCRDQGRPSIALRLWTASIPRYNVFQDDISLTLLIDSVRFQRRTDEDIGSRLRDMVSVFTSREEYVGLLDPPGYNPQPTWPKAREIFRHVVLDNWPHLSGIKSPLDVPVLDFTSLFTWKTDPPAKSLPSEEALYTHIIPSANTFSSYISLLGQNSLISEIPIALAWMKGLEIIPEWRTLCTALTYVDEAQGPRRWVKGWGKNGGTRLAGDGDVLRRWLQDWLGEGEEDVDGGLRSTVPTEEDVAHNFRRLMERSRRI